jgi:lauroyl/myristoyl acyltransferase
MSQFTSSSSGHGLWDQPATEASPRQAHRRSPAARLSSERSFSVADHLLYWPVLGLVRGIQLLLPLAWVAQIGRAFGMGFYHLDSRHRRVAIDNLTMAFGHEKTAAQIESIARENFKRLGENYACAIKTAGMSWERLRGHVEFTGLENFPQSQPAGKKKNAVVAIGHFGNFELYARIVQALPHDKVATTYRGLKQRSLSSLMQVMRIKSGCTYFERRTEGAALRAMLNRGGLILGLLADQNSSGMRSPFLGADCNTGLAPAILTLRYNAVFLTGICYRIGRAKWRIEFGKPIPTHINDAPRASEDLMLEANRELEAAVRRDPANWFWVHRRWKK